MVADLLRWNTFASIDLRGGSIEVGEPLGREQVLEVFGFLQQVVLPHVGNVLVNRQEHPPTSVVFRSTVGPRPSDGAICQRALVEFSVTNH